MAVFCSLTMPAMQPRYGTTAKIFHWTVAACLAVQLPLGWLMRGLRRGMPPDTALTVHVSIGLTILLLIVLRFCWRVTHPVAPEAGLPAWQRFGSQWVHRLLYVAVLGTALTGWLLDSARGTDPLAFGAPLPRLVPQGAALGVAVGRWHSVAAWILAGLIAAHIGAALLHLLVYRDRVMYRMLPGTPVSSAPPPR